MSTTAAPARRHPLPARRAIPAAQRAAPAAVAAAFAAAYVVISPPSADLAAQLFRAHLGLVLWNNWWYSGHPTLGYSVLFPPLAAALTPQLTGALGAVGTAAVFEPLARRHFGDGAWLGATLFGAATAIDLYTGRLTLALGALPALAAIDALDRDRTAPAAALAAVSALCSPVAALFAALATLATRATRAAPARRWRGVVVAGAALAPIALLALLFGGDGGYEPFSLLTLAPLLAIVLGAAFLAQQRALRTGSLLYGAAVLAAYLEPSPVGSNIARLGTLLALPLAALILWPQRPRVLAAVALPLLYVGWQAPVRDTVTAAGDSATTAAFYAPLIRFLSAQPAPPAPPAQPAQPAQPAPFRVEIPFTRVHWEALYVGQRFPLARGWERQLDTGDNPLFYGGRLTSSTYDAWLHDDAVRFVALPDAPLDPSAEREAALIRGGLPYLRPVLRTRHWRVYAVAHPTPLAGGPAHVTALGAEWVTLRATRAGTSVLRVHFTPYWALVAGAGCVGPAGPWTRVTLARPGPARLAIRFTLGRLGATTPRCT